MSLYIIAAGGTGAKFAESVIHLASIGLIEDVDKIKILFVDPDEANGNLDRARKTVESYQRCQALVSIASRSNGIDDVPWMIPKIELFTPNVWSPLSGRDNKNLSSLFNYESYRENDPLKNLFDTLFTEDERNLSLEMGFRGRPAIGAAVMSQLDLEGNVLDSEPWVTLFKQIKAEVGGEGKNITICLCGSAFGGTGASGFPTLGRLIANRLDAEGFRSQKKPNSSSSAKSYDVEKVKLGGILLLPYFSFNVPTEYSNSTSDEKIFASPDQFLLNTEAALRYYRVQAEGIFDTIYLLGNQSLAQVGQFSLGRDAQRNDPHFIEFYAALAARHFLSHKPKQTGEAVLISRAYRNKIIWSDLPDEIIVKQRLVNATRFAFAWLADLNQTFELAHGDFEQFARYAPWMFDFFEHKMGKKNLPKFDLEFEKISLISQWCRGYLRWLAEIHSSSGSEMSLQLFNYSAFIETDGRIDNANKFFELVSGGSTDPRDSVANLKLKLKPKLICQPNEGVVGLARALYKLCDKK